jgi:hypothetical protein
MASTTVPASGGGLAPYYQKFVSSGTFTLPSGYGASKPLLVNIQVIGGGGGGSAPITYVFNGNGGHSDYYGEGRMISGTYTNNNTGGPGGSGGLCATQLYLTSNLTITVGAAGNRGTSTTITNNENPYGGNFSNGGGGSGITIAATNAIVGGTGGTSTASVLQATGGAGGYSNTAVAGRPGNNVRYSYSNYNVGDWMRDNTNPTVGGGGTPAGTNGAATPLLGTLAGGSTSTTPVRGSFGIGGVTSDGLTSTGTEGSGGGGYSIGASGAVILTWWA